MADENFLLQLLIAAGGVEVALQVGKRLPQLGCRDPKWLAGRIKVEPELVAIADLTKAAQVVVHVHPGQRS